MIDSRSALDILTSVVRDKGGAVLEAWVTDQAERQSEISTEEIRRYAQLLLDDLGQLTTDDWANPAYDTLRKHLGEVSRSFALRRASPSSTATFIFGLKDALSPQLRIAISDPVHLWTVSEHIYRLIDQMGLHTAEVFIASREEMIIEQQQSIMDLSTPVVELWEHILALPVVGTVDSARTQQIMENLLQKIVDTGSQIVLMDITGVPIVDTTVAKHLMQTVAAARLMGAEVILVGISSRIAQTLVHLGVDLGDVTTRPTLAKGFALALALTRQKVVPM